MPDISTTIASKANFSWSPVDLPLPPAVLGVTGNFMHPWPIQVSKYPNFFWKSGILQQLKFGVTRRTHKKMKYYLFLANALLVPWTIDGSSDWLAGYDPLTYVADHAAIDLDLREMDKWLDIGIFQQAERIYTKGGHSQSRAKLRLLNADPPPQPFPAGTWVYGTSVSGDGVQGRLLNSVMWSQDDDQVIIEVEYDRQRSPRHSSYCQVGALAATNSAIQSGCKYVDC